MKKVSNIFIILLICLLLAACGCEHSYDNGEITTEPTCTTKGVKTYTCTKCNKTKTETVPKIEHEYVSNVTKEATFTEEGVITYQCTACDDKYDEIIPVKTQKVIVSVTGLERIPKDSSNWIFSNYVCCVFDVRNETDKDIRGIQGNLEIKDIFGENILTIGCDFTGNTIPAHKSIVVDDLSYEINEFIDADMKFYNTNYEDLQFNYVPTSIVYEDGVKEDC